MKRLAFVLAIISTLAANSKAWGQSMNLPPPCIHVHCGGPPPAQPRPQPQPQPSTQPNTNSDSTPAPQPDSADMQEYNRILNMTEDSVDRLAECRQFAERIGWGGAWLMCARISSRMRMDSTSLELYQKAAEVNCASGSYIESSCNEANDRVWWYQGRVHTPSFVPNSIDSPINENANLSFDNVTYLQGALSMYQEDLRIALAAQDKLAQTKDDILHYVGDNSRVAVQFETIRSQYEQSNPTAAAYQRLMDLKQNIETQSQTISDMTMDWAKQTKTNNANLKSIQANIHFLQRRIAELPQ